MSSPANASTGFFERKGHIIFPVLGVLGGLVLVIAGYALWRGPYRRFIPQCRRGRGKDDKLVESDIEMHRTRDDAGDPYGSNGLLGGAGAAAGVPVGGRAQGPLPWASRHENDQQRDGYPAQRMSHPDEPATAYTHSTPPVRGPLGSQLYHSSVGTSVKGQTDQNQTPISPDEAVGLAMLGFGPTPTLRDSLPSFALADRGGSAGHDGYLSSTFRPGDAPMRSGVPMSTSTCPSPSGHGARVDPFATPPAVDAHIAHRYQRPPSPSYFPPHAQGSRAVPIPTLTPSRSDQPARHAPSRPQAVSEKSQRAAADAENTDVQCM